MEKQWLVAMNDKGEFFGLSEGWSATSPFVTSRVLHAKLREYHGEPIEDPGYYFEDRWSGELRGFRMVVVSEVSEETNISISRLMVVHEDLHGTTHVDLSADLADLLHHRKTTDGFRGIAEEHLMLFELVHKGLWKSEDMLKYAKKHKWNGKKWERN